jgi:translation initiation factor IF-3
MIRVPQVRVVDEEGNQAGVMSTPDALRLAQDRGYDLVEVAPMASPPVTRLLDYGQFKYEQARREKEARKHQRSVDFKEIRLKVKIGKGDFDTKVRRSIEFLDDGDRVKVTVQFRGREVSHAYLGRDLLIRFAEQVGEHGAVERQPLLEGKQMSLVITSTQRPKPAPRPDGAEAEGVAPAGETAPAKEPAPTQEPVAAEKPAPVKEPVAAAKPTAAEKPAAAKPAAPKSEPVAEERAAALMPAPEKSAEKPAVKKTKVAAATTRRAAAASSASKTA